MHACMQKIKKNLQKNPLRETTKILQDIRTLELISSFNTSPKKIPSFKNPHNIKTQTLNPKP
jgi:hypothetical protein